MILSPQELAVRFIDFNESKQSFRGFVAGPMCPFRVAIQEELVSRGWIVRWDNDNSGLYWMRPEGYMSRDECLGNLLSSRNTYRWLAEADAETRAVFTRANPQGLQRLATFADEKLRLLESLPDGDFGPWFKEFNSECERIIA